MIRRADITGLVLAGGEGTRMGGAEKGLLLLDGEPLALHALRRLQPQVGTAALSANRHLAAYAAFGVPVWPDAGPGFDGPLAGLLAGLSACRTGWLAAVPCDTPFFPDDLVERLARAAADAGAPMAIACAPDESGAPRPQPVFCLLRAGLAQPLARFLAAGERRVGGFAAQQGAAQAVFDGAAAFTGANTPQALAALSARR